MVALLLVAVALGLSNFAAAVGIGVAGVDARTRLTVGLVFGAFETGMPIVGLLLGHGLASALGGAAHWTGAVLLVLTGLYSLVSSLRGGESGEGSEGGEGSESDSVPVGASTVKLLITGLALSVDNLAVGFALGAYRVGLAVAAIVIGAVSVALSLIGLELGNRIGTRVGERGELLGAVVLIAVGIAIAAGAI